MTGHVEWTARSPWVPAAPCTVADCLRPRPPEVSRLRVRGRVLVLVCGLVLGLAGAPVVRCLPRRGRYWVVRRWARLLLRAFGVRLRISGRPVDDRPALVVANHSSWLDVVALATVAPGRMLAKAEVGRYPVIGLLARYGGTLFIDRERPRALPAVVARVAHALRSGSTVVAFPEGSTWCGRRHGSFRPALFEAAVRSGSVVRPVAVSYRQPSVLPATAAAFVGQDTLWVSLLRVLRSRELTAEVVLLPPVEVPAAGERLARRALARHCTDLVMTRCGVTDYAREHDRAPSG